MELLDFVAAKFHEEGGVFKLLVSRKTFLLILVLVINSVNLIKVENNTQKPGFPVSLAFHSACVLLIGRLSTPSWLCSEWTSLAEGSSLSGSRN